MITKKWKSLLRLLILWDKSQREELKWTQAFQVKPWTHTANTNTWLSQCRRKRWLTLKWSQWSSQTNSTTPPSLVSICPQTMLTTNTRARRWQTSPLKRPTTSLLMTSSLLSNQAPRCPLESWRAKKTSDPISCLLIPLASISTTAIPMSKEKTIQAKWYLKVFVALKTSIFLRSPVSLNPNYAHTKCTMRKLKFGKNSERFWSPEPSSQPSRFPIRRSFWLEANIQTDNEQETLRNTT